jgi:2-oxo-4-hydroxy-4-carboxy-5-ureidoimidazoline decarboxylase
MSEKPTSSLAAINALDRTAFASLLGDIFEHSPWVAEGAWAARPFADVAALHRAMVAVMHAAGRDRQLQLIRAHPELAGAAAARGELTAASRSEQKGAGLASADEADLARFRMLNAAYREKFGFPFIIAVRGRSRSEILTVFAERLERDADSEYAQALQEIVRIAELRLNAVIAP